MSPRVLIAPVAFLSAGYVLGTLRPAAVEAQAPPPGKPPAATFPMDDRLGANLWLQTSAEYRACCLQTYALAGRRLEQLVAVPNPPARPAVILDLDETVFDNSPFQNALYAARMQYTPDLWDVYEKNDPGEVGLVPGAKAFIQQAGRLGVTVAYVSNRGEAYRESTVKALDRLGLGTDGVEGRLFLKTTTSDKTARRQAIEAKFNVVMVVGDNLRDFSEVFVAAKLPPDAGPAELRGLIAARQKQVDDAAAHWGTDWFILPNPVYGEWEKLLGPQPKAVLPPSRLDLAKAAAP